MKDPGDRYAFILPFLKSFGEGTPTAIEFQRFEKFYCAIYDPSFNDRKPDSQSNNIIIASGSQENVYIDDINLVRNDNFAELSKKNKKKSNVKVFISSYFFES